MTTITIQKSVALKKTSFASIEELYGYILLNKDEWCNERPELGTVEYDTLTPKQKKLSKQAEKVDLRHLVSL